jgi:hypothetical protein
MLLELGLLRNAESIEDATANLLEGIRTPQHVGTVAWNAHEGAGFWCGEIVDEDVLRQDARLNIDLLGITSCLIQRHEASLARTATGYKFGRLIGTLGVARRPAREGEAPLPILRLREQLKDRLRAARHQ